MPMRSIAALLAAAIAVATARRSSAARAATGGREGTPRAYGRPVPRPPGAAGLQARSLAVTDGNVVAAARGSLRGRGARGRAGRRAHDHLARRARGARGK